MRLDLMGSKDTDLASDNFSTTILPFGFNLIKYKVS